MTLLAHVAASAAGVLGRRGAGDDGAGRAVVVWVGARVWPTWHVWREAASAAGLDPRRHLMVDPPDEDARAWAVDLVLRTPGMVVVADGLGLERRERASSSRRFQLAAESAGSVGLLALPPETDARVSFAETRWTVAPLASPAGRACWEVGLVRRKGVSSMDSPRWMVERDRGRLLLADSLRGVLPEAPGRPDASRLEASRAAS